MLAARGQSLPSPKRAEPAPILARSDIIHGLLDRRRFVVRSQVNHRLRCWGRNAGRRHLTAGIADIGLYAYVHVAADGGFRLADYPALRGLIERVSRERGVLPIGTNPEASVRSERDAE